MTDNRDNIVRINLSVLPAPMRDVPFPAMGQLPDGKYYAVALSGPDAAAVFTVASPGICVYCIRMPDVRLCTSLDQAQEFFNDSNSQT